MTLLNEASEVHLGSLSPSKIYAGAVQVWPSPLLPVLTGTPVTQAYEYENGPGSYAGFTVTASGGTPPYTFSLSSSSGSFPAGISITAAGVVTGVPAAGTYGVYPHIVIQAIDSVGGVGKLPAFLLVVDFKDAYFANVNLLMDYDAPDGNRTFVDQKFGTVGTPSTSSCSFVTTVAPPYGVSSIFFNAYPGSILFADSLKWRLGSSPFTMDFMVRPRSVSYNSVNFMMCQFGNNSPNLSWSFYWNSNGSIAFNVSTTGNDNNVVLTSAPGLLVNDVWAKLRLDYDGTTYRIYKNGVMVAKAVASFVVAIVAQPMVIGANSSTFNWNIYAYVRGIRLTVGVARTASDAGYTVYNRGLPTS